jgi:hypothetical protein
LIAGVAKDIQTLRQIMTSKEWEELLDNLLKYVHNFQRKIVPDRGHFQL